MRAFRAWAATLGVLWALPVAANDVQLQRDHWPDAGVPASPVPFGPGQGAGVAFELDAGGFTEVVSDLEVYVATSPGGGMPEDGGTWRVDVWDHRADGGCLPPTSPQGNRFSGEVQLFRVDGGSFRAQLGLGAFLSSGALFISLRKPAGSAPDDTTIAVDQGPAGPGASWFFDPQLGWSELGPQVDAGQVKGLDRNWILRARTGKNVLVLPGSTEVVPSSGANDMARDITVRGGGYSVLTALQLGPRFITVVEHRLPDELVARVPAGFPPGTWDLRTHLASPSYGGMSFSSLLPDAYTVLDGGWTDEDPNAVPLTLLVVTPGEIWAGAQNGITVQGTGFLPGVALTVGGVVVYPLEWRSGEELGATLPPRSLPVGTWDVTVYNPSGRSATLPQALRVRGGPGCGCVASGVTADAWLLVGLASLALRRRLHRPANPKSAR